MRSIKTHWLFLLIVSSILILLQYTPYIYHRLQTPSDRVYLGAERYPPDYYVYLFYVNQGYLGNNLVYDYYTNEPHQGSLVHYEYLLAGKLGSFFGLSLPATYYLFRSATLIIYVLVSFWFIGLFFKNPLLHKLTFLLSFFWGGLFWPEITGSGINLKSYFDFYQPPDLINRLGFEPHKFLGMSLFLIILALANKTNLIFIFLALLSGFLHGITSISLIFTILFFIFYRSLIKPSLTSLTTLTSLIFPVSFLVLPLLYWRFVFNHILPWQNYSSFEKYFVNIDKASPFLPTLTGYLFILGPLIILGFIGLKKFLTENKNLGLLLFSFLTSNLFLFFLGYIFLVTSKHRYFQTPYLVGWSVLAMYGLLSLLSFRPTPTQSGEWRNLFTRFDLKKIPRLPLDYRSGSLGMTGKKYLLLFTLYFLLLFSGLPNFFQGLNRELSQFGNPPNLSLLAYPKKAWHEALLWMKNNIPKDSVILSSPTTGQIIPAVPGRKVVLGDYYHTVDYQNKLSQAQNFFHGQMPTEEAKNFLKKQKVAYVFYGWEEKSLGNLDNYSSLLTPVFANKEVKIYKIAF